MVDDDLAARVAALEEHVNRLYVDAGREAPYPRESAPVVAPAAPASPAAGRTLSAEVLGLLDQGQEIRAIRQYRNETGASMEEARDVIREVSRSHWR